MNDELEPDHQYELEKLLGIEPLTRVMYFFCSKCRVEGNPKKFRHKWQLEEHKKSAHHSSVKTSVVELK